MLFKSLKILSFVIFSFITTAVFSQIEAPDALFQSALEAQGSLQLEKSRHLFEAVLENPESSKEILCKTLRALAIQDWKFHENYKSAKEKLIQADSIGDYKSETWLILLRIEEESKQFEAALNAGKRAIALSQSDSDLSYAKYKYANAILNQALYQINSNQYYNTVLLKTASRVLTEILEKSPTHANAANALLGTSLLLKDGKNAYDAWLAYFRFSNSESAYAYLKPTAKTLNTILSKWNNVDLPEPDLEKLIIALGQSRFYKYAGAVAKIHFSDLENENTEITKLVNYADYLSNIKNLTNEHYRTSAINQGNTSAYLDTLSLKNENFYKQLSDKNDFNSANFRVLIRKELGAVMIVAQTAASSITGLILGHIVNERIQIIEQYGHKADFTFTELDMMTSNGYPSWFWEDRGAGGFAIPGGFLRIKTMFKFLGIDAWELVTDPIKRGRALDKIQNNLLRSTSKSNKAMVLAGLAIKLELDALDKLYNALVNQGYEGLNLQLKFIETYDGYRDYATMFAHEGRHSLDRIVLGEAHRNSGTTMIEYRGRLSQIAFSSSPKLELAGMINGLGTTPNGRANKMIIDIIEQWMIEHTKDIKEFDGNTLLIAQMYKLTDDQIITAIRAVDPFYIHSIKN